MSGRLERAGRRLLTRVVVGVLPARPLPPEGLSGFSPRRVLLVRHDDRIGNLVLMTPLLQAVKALWPEAETGVLIGPRFARLYQEEESVDHLWILEKRRILRNPLFFFTFLRELRGRGYDLAIDASHMHSFSLTGAALTFFSGAPVRVAYDRGQATTFANLLVGPTGPDRHEAEILAGLLSPFADPVPSFPMRLRLSGEERAEAERSIAHTAGEGRYLVGLHVGGRDAKRWPLERWFEVLEGLTVRPELAVTVLCGPGEEAEAAAVRARWGDRVQVHDDLDLRGLMTVVAACDLFLCPDTGPMHVAVALGIPTVGVFLQDNQARYGPPGSRDRVVRVEPAEGASRVTEAVAEMLGSEAAA